MMLFVQRGYQPIVHCTLGTLYIRKQCFLKRGESNSGTGQSPGHASRGQLITAVMRRMMVRMVRRTRARAAIGKLMGDGDGEDDE